MGVVFIILTQAFILPGRPGVVILRHMVMEFLQDMATVPSAEVQDRLTITPETMLQPVVMGAWFLSEMLPGAPGVHEAV